MFEENKFWCIKWSNFKSERRQRWIIEYVLLPGIPGVGTRTVGEVPRVRTDVGRDGHGLRRSQRQTKGQHSNPYHLSRSAAK